MLEQGLPPEFTQYVPDILESHAAMVARAVIALPVATALGAALAFRPRRRGTPPRSATSSLYAHPAAALNCGPS